MKRCLSGWLILLFAAGAQAHRLDECLQAARVAVAVDRVDISLELTPGVSIAAHLLPRIDKDQDGHISPAERDAYARRVLQDLRLTLDKKRLAPGLVDASVPTVSELRDGVGVIRLRATVSVGPLAAGNHELAFRNHHLPSLSVYQVNALVPKDDAVRILRQTRDKRQKNYRLEFEVKALRQQ